MHVTYNHHQWSWQAGGNSLIKQDGYGASPLAGLVTPELIDDLILADNSPDRYYGWNDIARSVVDFRCAKWDTDQCKNKLREHDGGKEGRALIVDVSESICGMFEEGWNPAHDLTADVVLLIGPGDNNCNPASANDFCKKHHRCGEGPLSKFPGRETAFAALAENRHVRAMYFRQAPPITHSNVYEVPLGVMKSYLEEYQRIRGASPGSLEANRTALYSVTHSMSNPWRREVYNEVQQAFGTEHLNYRYLPSATAGRLDAVVEDSMTAVFGESPPGVGLDCYRHYELLLSGAVPVVAANPGEAALRYLPHLTVRSWSEVTPSFLAEEYPRVWEKAKTLGLAALTRTFWRDHILKSSANDQ
jgi:hypothetical protein